ncbi:MAG: 30S ribosome-binding factor RbfA [Clostridiales bacterium]|nr:30S ribosome-binding factor RbfA [Clostridiales bacterium]
MANYRNDKIQEEMKRELDRIIRDKVSDPRLTGTFSITRVDVSKDLSHAKVYVSVLEDELKEGIFKALKSAAGFIRHELMQSMIIRYTPELQFVQDNNIEYGIRIDQLLKQVGAGTKKDDEHNSEEE